MKLFSFLISFALLYLKLTCTHKRFQLHFIKTVKPASSNNMSKETQLIEGGCGLRTLVGHVFSYTQITRRSSLTDVFTLIKSLALVEKF